MQGKYSPTVSAAYSKSQDWWKPETEFSQYDAEGFDSYGYDKHGIDREGNPECAYYSSDLFETVYYDWGTAKDGTPMLLPESFKRRLAELQKEMDKLKAHQSKIDSQL